MNQTGPTVRDAMRGRYCRWVTGSARARDRCAIDGSPERLQPRPSIRCWRSATRGCRCAEKQNGPGGAVRFDSMVTGAGFGNYVPPSPARSDVHPLSTRSPSARARPTSLLRPAPSRPPGHSDVQRHPCPADRWINVALSSPVVDCSPCQVGQDVIGIHAAKMPPRAGECRRAFLPRSPRNRNPGAGPEFVSLSLSELAFGLTTQSKSYAQQHRKESVISCASSSSRLLRRRRHAHGDGLRSGATEARARHREGGRD